MTNGPVKPRPVLVDAHGRPTHWGVTEDEVYQTSPVGPVWENDPTRVVLVEPPPMVPCRLVVLAKREALVCLSKPLPAADQFLHDCMEPSFPQQAPAPVSMGVRPLGTPETRDLVDLWNRLADRVEKGDEEARELAERVRRVVDSSPGEVERHRVLARLGRGPIVDAKKWLDRPSDAQKNVKILLDGLRRRPVL